eukprot:TRINITY_DN5327_c5_g1_i1.p1 TRINITY_DN5327_c5_g1~~TRINITY_DN5327_c5_g1_i1.p1  ORF type:complete len:259 (+),score=34.95 TRINITY_DN5327_c5_g1_i1:53-829(+)
MEESIYNLLPQPEVSRDKPPMWRSRHNGKLAPSYSTFGVTGTGKLQANCTGEEMVNDAGKLKSSAGMGAVSSYPEPKLFLKKKCSGRPTSLPAVKSVKGKQNTKLPSVPKRTDKPVMGLITERNFVIANAVDNIMMAPKRPKPESIPATQLKNYGKVPSYLTRVKNEIKSENEHLAHLHGPGSYERMYEIPEEDKNDLIKKMKEKWEAVHRQYLAITFSLDTISKVQRKEALEAELEQLEKAIAKMSKKIIYVYDDTY